MSNLLADLSPDLSAQVGGWLSTLFFLLGGVLVVLKIVSHFKPERPLVPSPMHVELQSPAVTRVEFDSMRLGFQRELADMERKLDVLKSEMHRNHIEVLNAGEKRAIHIHARIDDLVKVLSKKSN